MIRPWTKEKTSTPQDLCIKSGAMLIGGMIYFTLIAQLGQLLLRHIVSFYFVIIIIIKFIIYKDIKRRTN